MRLRLLILLGLGMGLLFLARPAVAQDGQPSDDDVNRVAKQLYCPVCENIPLDVCGTVACAQWRETIREKLAQGWTDQQIVDDFVTRYGERVLARPSTNGLTLFIWVLPPLVVVGGAAAWWWFLKRQKPGPAATSDTPAPLDPYVERMEQEFRKAQKSRGAP